MHPVVLHALELPTSDWGTWLTDRVRRSLADAGDTVAVLRESPAGDAAILELWNDAGLDLANAVAVTSLLSSVHPDPEVMTLAEDLEAETQRFVTDLMLDPVVFAQMQSVPVDGLDEGAARVLEDALRDYRRAGVDRDEATRSRLRVMQERETELSQAFSRNIRDGRRTTKCAPEALAGLPEDFLAEHPVGDDGMVEISTDYTDTPPVLEFAESRETRLAVLATKQDLAWPANDAVLKDLLDLRHGRATLLGYPDWPSYDAEVKMIGSGEAIGTFIDEIVSGAEAAAEIEKAALEEVSGEPLDLASWRHASHLINKQRFGVDSQEVRSYFDFTRVRQGLLDVTGRLFGLEYVAVDVPTWHEDVASYDVLLDDLVIGRVHLDLHPRDRKYNHAAQFDLTPGLLGKQLPEGVLVCNFPRALMDHDDVVTLFHEFGHLLHHVLAGRHRWVNFSGVATEWDFVEAPSQLLEEWAWDAGVLQTFARNAGGEPIPTELVAKMRDAEDFGKALSACQQMSYAAISYLFHLERPDDLTARVRELEKISRVAAVPGGHMHAGFGHLEGYSSAYYTYMWSLVIAKDLFSAFDPDDLFASAVALRYRDLILAPGGSKDAADLVADFLGRPYDTKAFTAWLNN